MNPERLLILVKTYPTLSTKYGETVCTAAMREDGSWVRLYPVPFRRLNETEQYKKFDWLECRIVRNTQDRRPESYRPVDQSELQPIAHIGTEDEWGERRKIVLEQSKVYLITHKPPRPSDPVRCRAYSNRPHWRSVRSSPPARSAC